MDAKELKAEIDGGRDAYLRGSDLARCALALLRRLDNLTTEEFSRGGEREERRALHAELVRLGLLGHDADGYPVAR